MAFSVIRARTSLIGDDSIETRLSDIETPGTEDLFEGRAYQSKEGIIADNLGAPLAITFQSLPRRELEAQVGATAGETIKARRDNAVRLAGRPYVPALVPGYCNYYHLLIDCFSRVLLSMREAAIRPRILITKYQNDQLNHFQENLLQDLLAAFELSYDVEILDGEIFYIKKAIVARGSTKLTGLVMTEFQAAARRISNGKQRRRSYISRSMASARSVVNEDEVIAAVTEFGFQVVHLERMSVAEQIALFHDSDVIVGPHGAGFANIVFAQPGTVLIELLQENALYKMPVFAELAGMAGCEHVILQSKGERNERLPGHAGNMNMRVDCGNLRNVLSTFVHRRSLGLRTKLTQKKRPAAAPARPARQRTPFEAPPILDVHFMGNLANRMIQYMVARRIAGEIEGCLLSNADLPEWNIHHPELPGGPHDGNGVPVTRSDVDVSGTIELLSSGECTRMDFKSYAQWFPNFPPLEFCRELFPADEESYPGFGSDFLVCNVRGGEILSGSFPHYVLLPVQFYAELAEETGLKMVFMGQVEENPYCDALRQRFPDAIFQPSGGPIADFQTFRNSKNLVSAVSTFSWMAAWLSHADSIVLPVNGMFNPLQCPAIDLLPYPDERYRFYLFPKNYSVPLDQLQAAHQELEGTWQALSQEEIPELRGSIYRRPMQVFDQFLVRFDEQYYLSTSKDVAMLVETGRLASGRDHYITHGFSEGRACFHFDADWYAEEYPDARLEIEQGEFESLLHHFVLSGAARGYKARATPILDIHLEVGFAERMVQFLVASNIAAAAGECVLSNALLPEWGILHPKLGGTMGETLGPARQSHHVDVARAVAWLRAGPRPRASLGGGGQWLSNFPDVEFSRKLFPLQQQEYPGYGRDHLVSFVEWNDGRDSNAVLLPVEFYADLARSTGLHLVFLGERESNAYWRALHERFPDAEFVASGGPKTDFQIFRNSCNLVPGVGLSSWLAAWLSCADRIELAVSGMYHPIQEPGVDLLPLLDERYRFHLFPINYSAPMDRLPETHAALAGSWRVAGAEELGQLRTPRRARRIEDYLPFFDEEFYVATYRDVAAAVSSGGIESGLEHYIARGFREGRGGFNFDARWYSVAFPEAARQVGDGEYVDLAHQYVEDGAARGYLPRASRHVPAEMEVAAR